MTDATPDDPNALELEQLDALHAVLLPLAMTGNLDATDRVLKISDRRVKLRALVNGATEGEGDELARLRAARDSRRAAT